MAMGISRAKTILFAALFCLPAVLFPQNIPANRLEPVVHDLTDVKSWGSADPAYSG
jgi:hypothetical protein